MPQRPRTEKGVPKRVKRRVVVNRKRGLPPIICYVPYVGRPPVPDTALHCQHDGIELYDGTIIITNPDVIEAFKAWCKTFDGPDDKEMVVNYQC